ncbi:MAG: ATP-binding cassette domain-containing protein [Methanimicrococcus sp.]|nr:ATP-binding cassette domain-containing protein [Methanimicrococcus sp.]
MEKSPLIDFNNISVIKEDRLILDQISLTIGAGENVAIIGPNGSGKSSLIKVMTREYYPLADVSDLRMKIMGEELWNIFDLRRQLGIITTDLQSLCLRDVTVFETVLSGFFSSIGIYDIFSVNTEMKATAYEILKFLNISHLSDKKMTQISTGEARKVLIARALVHDPQALVLDEPTNSLDMKSLSQFRKTISGIAKAGKNIIMVTHDLSDIIPEISRVILIKNGRIFADGPKDTILTNDNLTALFDVPVTVHKNGQYYVAFC